MEMKTVFSSHVKAVGYDPSSRELAIKFQNEKIAVYQDVPADVARMVTEAPSVGTALGQFVKGRFAFGYVTKID